MDKPNPILKEEEEEKGVCVWGGEREMKGREDEKGEKEEKKEEENKSGNHILHKNIVF